MVAVEIKNSTSSDSIKVQLRVRSYDSGWSRNIPKGVTKKFTVDTLGPHIATITVGDKTWDEAIYSGNLYRVDSVWHISFVRKLS